MNLLSRRMLVRRIGTMSAIDGMNPNMQLDLAALKHGANGYREGLLTGAALVDAGARRLALKLGSLIDNATMRADRAIRPVKAFQMLPGGVFVGIDFEECH